MEGGIKPGGETPARVVATADENADLSKAAEKVKEANTPHKAKVAPGLTIVLFADLKDKSEAEKAEKAVQKVKGVSAGGTKADAQKDEIHVQLTGDHKVTMHDLMSALKDAGITAHTTKGKA